MITNKEKIDLIIDRLNTIEFIIQSFIDHAEEFKNKYSLEEVLLEHNAKKAYLLSELESLGGIWNSNS